MNRNVSSRRPGEPDGSFSVECRRTPRLFLQTLDENHMAIENQLTGVVRPRRRRMCIGCHEARDTGLHNRDARPSPPGLLCSTGAQRTEPPWTSAGTSCRSSKASAPVASRPMTPPAGWICGPVFELVFHRRAFGVTIRPVSITPMKVSCRRPANPCRDLGSSRRCAAQPLGSGASMAGNWPGPTRGIPTLETGPAHAPRQPLRQRGKDAVRGMGDLGAQWDHIRGQIDLPGYDADESARLPRKRKPSWPQPIADPQQAFSIRCQECHDNTTLNRLNTYTTPRSRHWSNGCPTKGKAGSSRGDPSDHPVHTRPVGGYSNGLGPNAVQRGPCSDEEVL